MSILALVCSIHAEFLGAISSDVIDILDMCNISDYIENISMVEFSTDLTKTNLYN